MLDPDIFKRLPLASADSTNIARNTGLDKKRSMGSFKPMGKTSWALAKADDIEACNSADRYTLTMGVQERFELVGWK